MQTQNEDSMLDFILHLSPEAQCLAIICGTAVVIAFIWGFVKIIAS